MKLYKRTHARNWNRSYANFWQKGPTLIVYDR